MIEFINQNYELIRDIFVYGFFLFIFIFFYLKDYFKSASQPQHSDLDRLIREKENVLRTSYKVSNNLEPKISKKNQLEFIGEIQNALSWDRNLAEKLISEKIKLTTGWSRKSNDLIDIFNELITLYDQNVIEDRSEEVFFKLHFLLIVFYDWSKFLGSRQYIHQEMRLLEWVLILKSEVIVDFGQKNRLLYFQINEESQILKIKDQIFKKLFLDKKIFFSEINQFCKKERYYLGVDHLIAENKWPDLSDDEVKTSYKKLSKIFHPDLVNMNSYPKPYQQTMKQFFHDGIVYLNQEYQKRCRD